MNAEELPVSQRKAIQDAIEEGDDFLDDDRFEEAEQLYRQAAGMIPEPKYDYGITLETYTALGEALFYQLRFQEALDAFQRAFTAPGGFGNPLVYFRLGQAHYHLGNQAAAADAFGRACFLGGRDLFDGEDNEEYREIVAPILGSGGKPKGDEPNSDPNDGSQPNSE